MSNIDPNIFKAYDIRGIYPDQINEDVAYKIGQNFAIYSKAEEIIVGYDTRISSPALRDSLIRGITDQGVNVLDIGYCSTPCFYYILSEYQSGAGIMITASHNGKEFNGFKPMFKGSVPPTKEQILKLKEIVSENKFISSESKGKIEKRDPTDDYVKMVRDSAKRKMKPLKVVLDAGNGMAGPYIEKIFSGLGLKPIPIFTDLDGNFPNHETNPKIPENREKLVKKIIEEKADLGFMFDGDADRMTVLDRQGNLIDYSFVMALMAEYLVKRSNHKKVLVEVRTSKVVRDLVENVGGNLEVTECWTIPIKLKMKSDPEVIIGGETTGHYLFRETHESDDGIFSALLFLQAISEKENSVDEIIDSLKKKYFIMEEINFKVANKEQADAILKKLEKKYMAEGARILKIDGISAFLSGWSFNLRQSQTEPLIRLNLEADTSQLLKEKMEEVARLIK